VRWTIVRASLRVKAIHGCKVGVIGFFLFRADYGGCSWDCLLRDPAGLQRCERQKGLGWGRSSHGDLPY